MANITPRYNKEGKIISYKIKVFRGKDSNGKNLTPYMTTFKPEPAWGEAKIQRELNKFVTLYEAECKSSGIVNNKQTFKAYADYVIGIKERVEKKKHTTIIRYKSLLERINIAIGHIKLTDLRPQHLNKFYEMLGHEGTNLKTGKGLNSKTIIEHHRLIHTILKQAEKELLVQFNAAAKATPPVYRRKEANFIEVSDIENIL